MSPTERPALSVLRNRLLLLASRAAFHVAPEVSELGDLRYDDTVLYGPSTVVDPQRYTIELPINDNPQAKRRRLPAVSVVLAGTIVGALAQLGLGVFA